MNTPNKFPSIQDYDVRMTAKTILAENELSGGPKDDPNHLKSSPSEIFKSFGLKEVESFYSLPEEVQKKVLILATHGSGLPIRQIKEGKSYSDDFKVFTSEDGSRFYFCQDRSPNSDRPYGNIAWSQFTNGTLNNVNHDSNKGEVLEQLAKFEAQVKVAQERGFILKALQ